MIGAIGLGAMDMRDTPGGFSKAELSDALLVADAATVAVINMEESTPATGLDQRWWDLSSFHHVEVHQATGMIMEDLRVSAAQAFVRLRGYALSRDLPANVVARAIITRQLRLESDAVSPGGAG